MITNSLAEARIKCILLIFLTYLLYVSIRALVLCVALVKLHLLLPLLLSLLLPQQCYLTSFRPLTNSPNREKMERFIGTPVRAPPGFMANRQCLSLNRERQKGKRGWGDADKYNAEEQSDPKPHLHTELLKLT